MVSFMPGKEGLIHLVLNKNEARILQKLLRSEDLSSTQREFVERCQLVLQNAIGWVFYHNYRNS